MTGHVDTERILDAFLAPDHDQLPDRVLEASLADIARIPQRRAARVPWRSTFMPTLPRATGIAAAAIAVVVLAGLAYLLGTGRGLGPAAQASPSPTPEPTLDSCGHELAQGLLLTSGCRYDIAFTTPRLSVVSDGSWLDAYLSPNGATFLATTGPAVNTTVMLRMVRGVMNNPCDEGSYVLAASVPATAREYIDRLGGFVPAPRSATPVEAFGLRGLAFDLELPDPGATPTPDCTMVSLVEPAVLPSSGVNPDAIVVTGETPVRVLVLDTDDGVLLAVVWPTDDPDSLPAAQAFLTAITPIDVTADGTEPAPVATPAQAAVATFVSGRYGFSIDYPRSWSTTTATSAWSTTESGNPESAMSDHFKSADGSLLVTAWAEAHPAGIGLETFLPVFYCHDDAVCKAHVDAAIPITMLGAQGKLVVFDDATIAFVDVDGVYYAVAGWNPVSVDQLRLFIDSMRIGGRPGLTPFPTDSASIPPKI